MHEAVHKISNEMKSVIREGEKGLRLKTSHEESGVGLHLLHDKAVSVTHTAHVLTRTKAALLHTWLKVCSNSYEALSRSSCY